MKLAFKVALALVLAIASVQIFFGFLRVHREVDTFVQDAVTDHFTLGGAMAYAAARVVDSHGVNEAASLIDHTDDDYESIDIRWAGASTLTQPRHDLVLLRRKDSGAVSWKSPAFDEASSRVLTLIPVVHHGEVVGVLASVMRRDGYLVTEARDGEELVTIALDLMDGQGRKLDLIVSDIRMPGHTGLDVLRLLRGFGWDVPIILITAFGDLRTHRAAEQSGVHAVLDKPFELDDLRTLLLHFAPPR